MNNSNRVSACYQYQAGIGFIEILIAAFVISLAVLGLGQMLSSSSESATNSKAQSEAIVLAEQQLEQLRGYATYSEYNTSVVDASAPDVTGTNAVFTPTVAAVASTVVDPLTDPEYRDVTINVSWAGTEGTKNATITDRIAQEEPIEAGAKLLTLAQGDKPNFDTVYDPSGDPDDPDTDPTDPDPDPDLCESGCTPVDVGDDGEVVIDPADGIYVFGAIDTRNASYDIISVQAFGNFLTVTCPPGVGSGGIQGYDCHPLGTTSGETDVWNVNISVTVQKNSCTATNLYSLGELTNLNNYFPRTGTLTVPSC